MSRPQRTAAAPAAAPLAAEPPEPARRRELRTAAAAQRAALHPCERQFAEAARALRQLTELVPAQPARAGEQAQALTRALVDKMVNDAAIDMSGLPREALVGRGVTALATTPEEPAFWADAHAGLEDRLLSDSLLERADGSVRPMTRRISALEREGRRVFVVAMRGR